MSQNERQFANSSNSISDKNVVPVPKTGSPRTSDWKLLMTFIFCKRCFAISAAAQDNTAYLCSRVTEKTAEKGILSQPHLATSPKIMRENRDLISDVCLAEAVLPLQSLCRQSYCVDPVLTRHQMYQELSPRWSFMGKSAARCNEHAPSSCTCSPW